MTIMCFLIFNEWDDFTTDYIDIVKDRIEKISTIYQLRSRNMAR